MTTKEEEEIKRLQKLREQQLQVRDPSDKEKKLHRKISQNAKKHAHYSFRQMLDDLPAKWFYLGIGAVLGGAFSLILAMFIQAWWVGLIGLALTLFLAIVGRVIGVSEDFRRGRD